MLRCQRTHSTARNRRDRVRPIRATMGILQKNSLESRENAPSDSSETWYRL